MQFENGLTDAQAERLALLIEEMGEALQAVGKVLRHGYDSTNPLIETGTDNGRDLENECGHVLAALKMLCDEGDLTSVNVTRSRRKKLHSVKQWLHHQ